MEPLLSDFSEKSQRLRQRIRDNAPRLQEVGERLHSRGYAMFAHMFPEAPTTADLRRRVLTQIDVVVDRYSCGPMKWRHLIIASFLALCYVRGLCNFITASEERWLTLLDNGLVDPRP